MKRIHSQILKLRLLKLLLDNKQFAVYCLKNIYLSCLKAHKLYYLFFLAFLFTHTTFAQRPTFEQNAEKSTPLPNFFNFGKQDSSTQNVRSLKAPEFFAESYRFSIKPLRFNTEAEEIFPTFYEQGLFFHRLKDRFPLRLGIAAWNTSSRTRIYAVSHPDSMREQKRVYTSARFSARSNILGAHYTSQDEHIIFAKTQGFPVNVFNKNEVKVCKPSLYEGRISRNIWFSVTPIIIPETEDYPIAYPCLSLDKNTLYFVSNMPEGYGGTDIYVSNKQSDGSWSVPQNLGDQVNSSADEITPFYHEDGNLYFASNRQGGMGGFDIYEAKKIGAFFEKVKNLGAPINSEDDDISFIINDSKRIGYFASNRRGNFDIYKSNTLLLNISRNITDGGENVFGQFNFELTGHIFDSITGQPIRKAIVKIRDVENDDIRIGFTDNSGEYRFPIQNEKRYQLAVTRMSYQTTKDYEFSTFGILRPVPMSIDMLMSPNTYRFRLNVEVIEKDTISEIVKKNVPDARILLEETASGEVKEVYADLQGKYTFDLQQDKNYKLTVFKDGFDISLPYRLQTVRRNSDQSMDLQIPLTKTVANKRRAVIRAIVTDTEDGRALIGATIGLKNKGTGQTYEGLTDDNGIAIFVVDTLYSYQLWASKDKYQANDYIDINMVGVESGKVVEAILPMRAVNYKPIPLNFVMPSIYYPAGKITFNEEVQTQLDAVVKIMKEYQGVKIQVFSHTDNTDKPKTNEELSRQRANAAVSYLVKKGIDRKRILATYSLGATKMKNDCNKMNCTEDQHAENRRIDFAIVER
jgi:outer membrane protein OmpA-like peptidoglycan-associated protein/5-hydroxyisourate hydrolase-like protein (transthyretin family)